MNQEAAIPPSEAEANSRAEESPPSPRDSAQDLIRKIRRRAARLHVASWLSFSLVILVVAGGAVFFWYAGSIAAADAKASAPAEFQFLLRDEKNLSDSISNVQKQVQSTIEGTDGTVAACGPKCADLVRRQDVLRQELTSVRKRIAEVDRAASSPASESITSANFINTTLTRVLIVALLVFLVQILASQYRYTLRMSHHFDQVADAMDFVSGNSLVAFSTVLQSMTSTGIDFAGTLESPINAVPELVKSLRSRS